jgi:hypothetical protein
MGKSWIPFKRPIELERMSVLPQRYPVDPTIGVLIKEINIKPGITIRTNRSEILSDFLIKHLLLDGSVHQTIPFPADVDDDIG